MRETSSGGTARARLVLGMGAILLTNGVVGTQVAWAQEPPPAPPPAMEAAPPAPPPVMAPPPVVAPPAATPPAAVEAAPKPPTAAESMPATRPEVLPPIQVGAWTRVGSVFQNGSDPKKMNDFRLDTAYVELHAGGKIHKNVGVTLNLNGNILNFGGADPTGMPTPSAMNQIGSVVGIMDAIIQFDIMDEVHVWAGHLLVPVDRANAAGPFFMIPWNYPGFFSSSVGAPKEGPSGRNNGAVVWGDISGGKLTYLAGVFDNANIGTSPLFSGRLRLALWDPEPGFWGNASFFGEKDILSIGVGGQFQKHGSAVTAAGVTTDKDWTDINADLLVEKKLPGGGWVTAEGAYYHFNVLDGGVSDSWYGLLAYATPTIGVGNIQPMVRYQGLKVKANTGDNPWNLDAAVSYLIKGPALRLIATYSHTKLATDVTGNSIQLGAQAIFF